MRDHFLELLGQRIPGLQVDGQLVTGGRLMPAGGIVICRRLVQPQVPIVIRADPFAGIDHAALQGGENLRGSQQHDFSAHRGDDFSAQAGNPHLEPVIILDAVDRLAVPAAHLGAGVARREANQAFLGVELLPQIHAPAMVHPGGSLLGVHAEGHRTGELGGGHLAGPVIGSRIKHMDTALPRGIEDAEGGHQLVGTKYLDVQLPLGHYLQIGGQGRQASAQHGSGDAETHRQTPFETGLGVSRFAGIGHHGHGGRGRGADHAGLFKKCTSIHFFLLHRYCQINDNDKIPSYPDRKDRRHTPIIRASIKSMKSFFYFGRGK